MRVFSSKSADGVWRKAFAALGGIDAHPVMSRSGGTRELLHATLCVEDPRRRWIPSRLPAMNPAFALAEVAWIMAGRDDVPFLEHWNTRYPDFVGSRRIAYGAYGYRLRTAFGVDQLKAAYLALRSNPQTRQCVLQLWSADCDLPTRNGRPRAGDIPCNNLACLRISDGRLHWLQVCRSNDIVLGFPHNVVQFTTLQEIVAGWLGVDVGPYSHVVSSLHVYDRDIGRYQASHEHLAHDPEDQRLPYSVSVRAWRSLNNHAQELVGFRGKTPAGLRRPRSGSLPKPTWNAYWILAAEDARRRGWNDEVDASIERTSDVLLRSMWQRWRDRVKREGRQTKASANEIVS